MTGSDGLGLSKTNGATNLLDYSASLQCSYLNKGVCNDQVMCSNV